MGFEVYSEAGRGEAGVDAGERTRRRRRFDYVPNPALSIARSAHARSSRLTLRLTGVESPSEHAGRVCGNRRSRVVGIGVGCSCPASIPLTLTNLRIALFEALPS